MGIDFSSPGRTSARTTLRVDPPVSTAAFVDRVRSLGPVDDIENCYDTHLSGATFAERAAPGGVEDCFDDTVERMAVASFSFSTDRQVSYMELGDPTVRERTETDERTVTIVYHEDGYAFVSGPGGRTATEGETVARRLFGTEDIESVDVDEPFLRWLVWRAHSGDELASGFDICRVTGARVVGGGPPEEFQLTGAEPLGSEQPRRFLERVRDGHRIDRVDADFRLEGVDLHGYVSSYAGLRAGLQDSEHSETAGTEVLLGVVFCLRVVELFERRSALDEPARTLPLAFEDALEAALADTGDG